MMTVWLMLSQGLRQFFRFCLNWRPCLEIPQATRNRSQLFRPLFQETRFLFELANRSCHIGLDLSLRGGCGVSVFLVAVSVRLLQGASEHVDVLFRDGREFRE